MVRAGRPTTPALFGFRSSACVLGGPELDGPRWRALAGSSWSMSLRSTVVLDLCWTITGLVIVAGVTERMSASSSLSLESSSNTDLTVCSGGVSFALPRGLLLPVSLKNLGKNGTCSDRSAFLDVELLSMVSSVACGEFGSFAVSSLDSENRLSPGETRPWFFWVLPTLSAMLYAEPRGDITALVDASASPLDDVMRDADRPDAEDILGKWPLMPGGDLMPMIESAG